MIFSELEFKWAKISYDQLNRIARVYFLKLNTKTYSKFPFARKDILFDSYVGWTRNRPAAICRNKNAGKAGDVEKGLMAAEGRTADHDE